MDDAIARQSDGFVLSTPSIITDPPGCQRTTIRLVYPEWNSKAVGFVSYGSALGARGGQQLRETNDSSFSYAPTSRHRSKSMSPL